MLQYYPKIYDLPIINELINNIPWREVYWKTNSKLPRLVASLPVEELLEYVPELISIVENVSIIGKILSCWLNYYRDGNDYTPYHKDSYQCTVLNISFGGVRKFSYKPSNGGNAQSYDMSNGDCIMFDQEFNDHYVHTLTKTKKQCQPRVSLVLFVEPHK